MIFLPKVEPVIRPEHDNRIVPLRTGIQSRQHPTDLGVCEADTRGVGTDELLIGTGSSFVHFHHPAPEPLFGFHQLQGTRWEIIPIISLTNGQSNTAEAFVVFGRGKKWRVRFEYSAGQEERLR